MTHVIALVAFGLGLFVAVYALCLACYLAGVKDGRRQEKQEAEARQ